MSTFPLQLQEEIPKVHVAPVLAAVLSYSRPMGPIVHLCGSSFLFGGWGYLSIPEVAVLPGLPSCLLPSSDNLTAHAVSSWVFSFPPWVLRGTSVIHLIPQERLPLLLLQAGVTTFFVGLHQLLFILIYSSASSSST